MELDKIIPADGPNINEVEKYINKYQSEVIVIKCGGSVLLDKKLFNQFIEDISVINKIGLSAIVVHGGGKNIKKKLLLDDPKIVKTSFYRDNLSISIFEKNNYKEDVKSISKLIQDSIKNNDKTIIYCKTQKETEKFVEVQVILF